MVIYYVKVIFQVFRNVEKYKSKDFKILIIFVVLLNCYTLYKITRLHF